MPLAESAYDRCLTDRASAKDRREELSEACAAWFPDAFPSGDACCGSPAPSMHQHLLGRRMRREQGRTVCTIAPALVLPSMPGRTQDVAEALFCRRWPVPCWAMAHVLGREALSWDRLEQGLGRCSVVGTTVKSPEHFPKDLVADATQSGWKGARVSMAPTAAHDGLLGASVALAASPVDVEKASGVLARAAQAVDAASAPETVKTDGWHATQGAWPALCTPITGILCVLPALLNSRERATQTWGNALAQGHKRVWEASHAPRNRALSQRLRRVRAWAETALPDGVMQSRPLAWCAKRDQLRKSSDHPEAPRTSHRGDRLMQCVDRAFFHAQYGHGMPDAAEHRGRA